MAGVGEVGAIAGLISTAASLSKAVIDIASKYKVARLQIESFGQEVGNLGKILGQLHHLYIKDDLRSDRDVISVIVHILINAAASSPSWKPTEIVCTAQKVPCEMLRFVGRQNGCSKRKSWNTSVLE